MQNKRYSLPQIIFIDLMHHGKMAISLLMMILMSAIFVVHITYQTRLCVAQRERLFLQRHALDIEWRNLILEENALVGNNGTKDAHQQGVQTKILSIRD
ncbi:Cell division protein FtsL [Candidatus Erwinia haradaeae]|uniref:Cell division protein FtsL n=1 Tax=Candidatus Erwinia haradaeae TaxID=1922217 RepID=A0A451DJA0_9GAMM|nr:cell division protein FtsL [Candidatus Erwinia haradaeae]VFP86771.1 Cell division protein FtsL [Candidatus Erwinia haradaeae]